MSLDPNHIHTAFRGSRILASGALNEVAVAVQRAGAPAQATLLVFSDATGDQVDLDLRGSDEDVRSRYRAATSNGGDATPRARGRPRLGVVSREVTLLPEQWEWLASQPGGASVTLRKLVQQARRSGEGRERLRRAQERSYKVMVALAGDRPGFEEAARALFANDMQALRARIEAWPRGISDHVLHLADPEYDPTMRSPE